MSLGTRPDFAFAGPGVKVAGITPGSAAEEAGLAVGDILIVFAGKKIADLRAYSEALKGCAPGDKVELTVRRGEKELQLKARLRVQPPIYQVREVEPWSRLPERRQALVPYVP